MTSNGSLPLFVGFPFPACWILYVLHQHSVFSGRRVNSPAKTVAELLTISLRIERL